MLLGELNGCGDELLTQKLLDCFLNLSVSSPIKQILNGSDLSMKLLHLLELSEDVGIQGVIF